MDGYKEGMIHISNLDNKRIREVTASSRWATA
jgi:translation initiation factor 2 alpha subunit (eIF-2alpha)